MLLSIIIPVYNGEKTIKQCIESIIKNTNSDKIEIIIINDGSNDNTSIILKEFSDIDKRIIVYNNSNHGVSYSRNYGLENASGKYIMFVDADDYLSEDWFDIIEKDINKNLDIIYYSNQDIDYNMKKEMIIEEIMELNGKHNYFPCPFSKILKKEKIANLKFTEDIINGEDMLFNLEMILKAEKYAVFNKSFYNYRIYNGSSTKRFNPKIINSDKKFHDQLEKILLKSNLSDKFKNDIKKKSLRSGIIILCSRFSYINKYSEVKEMYKNLENEPYKSIIDDSNYNTVNKKARLILLLCKFKLYYILFKMLKLYNKNSCKGDFSEKIVKI